MTMAEDHQKDLEETSKSPRVRVVRVTEVTYHGRPLESMSVLETPLEFATRGSGEMAACALSLNMSANRCDWLQQSRSAHRASFALSFAPIKHYTVLEPPQKALPGLGCHVPNLKAVEGLKLPCRGSWRKTRGTLSLLELELRGVKIDLSK